MARLIAVFFALMLAPSMASADPISLALSALASSTLTFSATAGFAFSFSTTGFLLRAGLGIALNALQPKQGGGIGARQVNTLNPAEPHGIIYGERKVGGNVFFQETTGNNKYLHRCIAVAGHSVDSFQTIYLNDEAVTLDGSGNVTAPDKYAGLVRIKTHLGSTTQLVDPDLVAESEAGWTDDCRAQGVAYIYARFQSNKKAYPNGVPVVTVLVRGKNDIYDPRDASTGYSANAALCLRDYLIYRGVATTAEIDTIVTAAANICDENVTLAVGGTEPRYECHAALNWGNAASEVLPYFISAMGGSLWHSLDKWGMKAGHYVTPTVTLGEDDLRSGIKLQTRQSIRDNFNSVQGVFSGPTTNWQDTNYPPVTSATFKQVDGGVDRPAEINLPFTTSATAVQRIAKSVLYRNREQAVFSASFGMNALKVRVGDVVMIDNTRFGYSAKPFEVEEWSFASDEAHGLLVRMTLREISSAVDDWSAEETAFETNNTALLSPFDVPAVGITPGTELRVIAEHLTNVLKVTVSSSASDRVDYVQVEFKKSADADYKTLGQGEIGLFEWLDLEDGTYDIRARAVNELGIRGDWSYQYNYAVTGLGTPPADVTGFSADLHGGVLVLSWDAVPDLDLSYYKIRHSTEETGATWANATTAVAKVARPGMSATVPVRSGTYHIRAYDKLGTFSQSAVSVVVPATAIATFATSLTQVEHAAFAGVKTNCSVAAGALRLTTFTTAPATGTYEFSGGIDAVTAQICRVRVSVSVQRIDTSGGLWDDMTGLWDSWSGLWDDWTGVSQFADTDVLMYYRATPDDPAGSPTWGAWTLLQSTEIYGRGFEFKVVLNSTANNVTPEITALTAYVEHN